MAQLNWGMIGGGEGSQIGPAHRLGALADGHFKLAAGALDHRPDVGRDYAQRLGVAADRAYGDWQEMLAGERNRPDRCDLVTVATPNSTHFEITKAFLEAGFNDLCEKPMTVTEEEGFYTARSISASEANTEPPRGYTADIVTDMSTDSPLPPPPARSGTYFCEVHHWFQVSFAP